jgi:hypothetical protein
MVRPLFFLCFAFFCAIGARAESDATQPFHLVSLLTETPDGMTINNHLLNVPPQLPSDSAN